MNIFTYTPRDEPIKSAYYNENVDKCLSVIDRIRKVFFADFITGTNMNR